MPVKWDSMKVSENLDKIEDILQETMPLIRRAVAVIDSTATLENLPGYVLSGLHYLRFLLEADLPNLMMRCQTIKLYFPKTAPTTPQRPPVMLGTAATTADTWREVMSNA